MQSSGKNGGISSRKSIVDLRSDTVTKPTEAMYDRMRHAPTGDDSLDGEAAAVPVLELFHTVSLPTQLEVTGREP